MVPTLISTHHSSRLLYILYSIASHNVLSRFSTSNPTSSPTIELHSYAKRNFNSSNVTDIVFACLIPILVLLSGLFAGLTLGYMSLDETQLNVLSISGTPKQRINANKIKPIRKNGHLLLVTLLLANMIVNESLPVISAPVLGGGVPSVVVSTVLIVIFAEIIPQSVFTRHGLYLCAKMAGPTKFLIYLLGVISWPVAKLLEFVLGSHHGIIYRRAELKELIAMHSHGASHGGDLKNDTVTIIGATLDLQEKVVEQAMTPISDVFMLSIDSKLDYELLKKICTTGHSRVPVYEEVELPMQPGTGDMVGDLARKDKANPAQRVKKVKKIVGILLVKQCVLLDPNDTVPLRKIPLNKVPFVPSNEPLLGILDKFQEGRSHMAIVSRFSVDKAASVKKAVKRGLTQRLRQRVGIGESSDEDEDGNKKVKNEDEGEGVDTDGETLKGDGTWEIDIGGGTDGSGRRRPVRGRDKGVGRIRGRTKRRSERIMDVEMGSVKDRNAFNEDGENKGENDKEGKEGKESKSRRHSFQLAVPSLGMSMMSISVAGGLEQSMPADAVLAKEGAEEFLQSFDPAVMPLGIITLEDVLEELIGEEIYDEFDTQGAHGQLSSYISPAQEAESVPVVFPSTVSRAPSGSKLADQYPTPGGATTTKSLSTTPVLKPNALRGLSFLRSKSAPPIPREQELNMDKDLDTDLDVDADNPILVTRSTSRISRTHSELGLSDLATSQDKNTSLVLSEPPSASSSMPQSGMDKRSKALPSSTVVAPVPGKASTGSPLLTPIPRSASPAPSLEAVLLDRKRRLTAAGVSGSTGISVASLPVVPPATGAVVAGADTRQRPVTGVSAKGTMFKSSPLVGGG